MAGQRIELPPYSMFAETPVYEVGSDIVFGLMQDVIVPDPSDDIYTVPPAGAGRLDLIADNFYGAAQLWWVIARVNTINDPLIGPQIGDRLRIPTKQRLAAAGVLNV